MELNNNIALIDCSKRPELSRSANANNLNGYVVKKLLTVNKAPEDVMHSQFPEAQLVNDVNSIIEDTTIDLILVAKPSQTDIHMVGEAVQAGKNVRII